MIERRSFIKKLIVGGVTLHTFADALASGKTDATTTIQQPQKIRIALVGKGGMGTADANCALSVQGVEIVAVCDLYDARLADAKKQWGDGIFTTKDYKEILTLKSVDAVIIGTPDHWHQPIAIAALNAGKHVYCEKPVIHKVKEGKALIEVQQNSGCLFQVGSQGMASLGNRAARLLIQSGAIGKVNFVDGQFSAGPGILAQYPVPEDASPESIWWDRFIGNAPKHSFEPQRFFYWRNWKDYGTGIAGDLFVHVLASVHYILDAEGPEKVYTTGGIRHYTDGFRDTPDIMLGYFDYPDRNNTGAFTVSLGANMVDGVSQQWGSTNFKIIGDKGTLIVEWDKVTLKTQKDINQNTFECLQQLGQGMDVPQKISSREFIFRAEQGYKGGHYDHFCNFFHGIRNKTPLVADVLFGVRSAVPALLSYESYLRGKPIYWDAKQLKEIKK